MNIKKLYQGTLTGGSTKDTLVTAVRPTAVRHIQIANYSASDATIKFWHDGTTNACLIVPATTVVAGGMGVFGDDEIYLEQGDTLIAESSAATALTVTVYGEVLDL